MSATGNQTAAPAAEAGAENAIAELLEKYGKKDKVVYLPGSDDFEAFVGFAEKIGDANYVDWSKDLDNKVFTGLAMVRGEDGGPNRLIGIASEDAALSDPGVRKALYRMYVNRVVNAAMDKEAMQSQFVTVGGTFKQNLDLDAFNFQWKAFSAIFREAKVSGVTKNSLRQSFASAAFAKTQFPRIPEDTWEKLIGIGKKNADRQGYATAIFDHWTATRSSQSADTSPIVFDFGEVEKEIVEDTSGNKDETPASA